MPLVPEAGRCPPVKNVQWHTNTCEHKKKYPDGATIGMFHIGKTGGSTVSLTLINVLNGGYTMNVSEMHTGSQKAGGGQGDAFDLIIVTSRDPVNRTISAFNYELENGNPADSIKALQACYPGNDADGKITGAVEQFALSLSDPYSACGKLSRRALTEYVGMVDPGDITKGQIGYFGHLNMGHMFYMGYDRNGEQSNLNQVRLGKTKMFLVRADSLVEDLQKALQWLCMPNVDIEQFLQNEVPELTTKPDGTRMSSRHDDTELSPEARKSMETMLGAEYSLLEQLEMLAVNGRDKKTAAKVAKIDHAPAWDA